MLDGFDLSLPEIWGREVQQDRLDGKVVVLPKRGNGGQLKCATGPSTGG